MLQDFLTIGAANAFDMPISFSHRIDWMSTGLSPRDLDGGVESAACASLLKRCANAKELAQGKRVHKHIVTSGRYQDRYLANLLVDMYGKCSSLEDARAVFNGILEKNTISWNIMLRAYTQNGHCRDALQLFSRMHLEGEKPDTFTFSTALAACSNLTALAEGKAIDAQVAEYGLDESNIVVGNCLISLYSKCGSLDDARAVFNGMQQRDAISWNTMITAYAQHGHGREAIELFHTMLHEGMTPTEKAFLRVVGACSSLRALAEGKLIHEQIVASGFVSDVLVANSLVNMYGKCGSLDDARNVLDTMHQRTVASWNAMITAYAQNGHGNKALELFSQMDVEPNEVTFLNLVTACTSLGNLVEGKRIHACIAARGFESQVVLGNALVNMYGKSGMLEDAGAVFDKIHHKDAISWNAMIAACAQHGYGKKALELLWRMDLEGIKADSNTLTSALDACTILEALAQGEAIRARITVRRIVTDDVIGTALLNLYGKCGRLDEAWEIFDTMRSTDVVSWNAMIAAYAQHGHSDKALQLFWKLGLEGVDPDHATFVSILSACSHAGLFDDGCGHFVSLSRDHNMTPNAEHYRCMMDLLGRAGRVGIAEEMLHTMPFQPNSLAWMTLLSACKLHGHVDCGIHAAEQAFKLDPKNASPYLVLSNMCAEVGRVRMESATKGLERDL